MKKNLGSKFWPTGPKSDQKLGFLPFSQDWFISFPLNTNIITNQNILPRQKPYSVTNKNQYQGTLH